MAFAAVEKKGDGLRSLRANVLSTGTYAVRYVLYIILRNTRGSYRVRWRISHPRGAVLSHPPVAVLSHPPVAVLSHPPVAIFQGRLLDNQEGANTKRHVFGKTLGEMFLTPFLEPALNYCVSSSH